MEWPITDYRFLQALRDLPFVEAIWLFGSRARGFARPRSDIDLALLCPGAGAAEWAQAEAIIETADTLLPIDLVRFDTLAEESPLRQAILETHVPIFARAPA